MRNAMKQINEIRAEFSGTFERFGTKSGYKGPERTVLLRDVVNADGEVVADHLWFNFTKGFEALDLQPGDKVTFTARVTQYVKGYNGRREDVYKPRERDYRLSYPTKIRRSGT